MSERAHTVSHKQSARRFILLRVLATTLRRAQAPTWAEPTPPLGITTTQRRGLASRQARSGGTTWTAMRPVAYSVVLIRQT